MENTNNMQNMLNSAILHDCLVNKYFWVQLINRNKYELTIDKQLVICKIKINYIESLS